MNKKIVILGAGMVGRTMAIDLSKDFEVLSVDRDESVLKLIQGIPNLTTLSANISDPDVLRKVIEPADIVVGAVPGFMGFKTLKTVIEAGKDIVDISFFPEDPFELDELAKQNGVTAIMDAGVAPGMSNIILGYHHAHMQVENFVCYVGGLPVEKTWPYEYKAPFSPIDVIEEYTRTARIVEDGQVVEKPALSEPETIEFSEIGKLEAFNTDGLRSLIKTMNIPNMKEKTLRYSGHIELMRIFRETGFFDEQEVQIGDQRIRPIDLTTQLLFPKWKLGEQEAEFTLMQVSIQGTENKQAVEYNYSLLDYYDPETGASSMSRTTGYTCTANTRLVLNGHYSHKGISPPEYVGAANNCFQLILDMLADRGVHYKLEKVGG